VTVTTHYNRSWLAIASFIISLLALCTLPLPLIPSTLLGILGVFLGGIALWRMRRLGEVNRDHLFAFGGIIIGIVPLVSLCITAIILVREIPHWLDFLSNRYSQLTTILSNEIPKWVALLSNLFR
jgi:hypothetical protein